MTQTIAYILIVINVLTFLVYGIDKWKAKQGSWRISEVTLLLLAVIGGSIGALLGMKVWHHKTMHKKFKYGLPLILLVQIALLSLCSCATTTSHTLSSNRAEHNNISVIADKVWSFAKSHPDGFTLNLRTMTEPKEGIAVSYAATQNSHSRDQLDKVISHALQHDGYVGGWHNQKDGLYYFDSTRLFPEDSLAEAIRFGKENGQSSAFILSSSTEVPIMENKSVQEHSPNVFLVMYDAEIGKAPLQKAIKEYQCEIVYDYGIINGMALKKPENKTLEETMQYFKTVKGVISVEYDHIIRLTAPVKPKIEIK